jgi:hypothetical protein
LNGQKFLRRASLYRYECRVIKKEIREASVGIAFFVPFHDSRAFCLRQRSRAAIPQTFSQRRRQGRDEYAGVVPGGSGDNACIVFRAQWIGVHKICIGVDDQRLDS